MVRSKVRGIAPKIESRESLLAQGKALRARISRASQSFWKCPSRRIDPLQFLTQSNQGRLKELIPVRHGRMLVSPFAFFRGSAGLMAADLSHTPSSGIRVQACGDAHLVNFGAFATPERRLIFDINDFDETLPAPWEWDIKRLAASFVIASRNNGHREAQARDSVLACLRSYRERMAAYAQMTALDVWYERIDIKDLIPTIREGAAKKRLKQRVAKARAHDLREDLFPKLAHIKGGEAAIRDNPPLIFHFKEVEKDVHLDRVQKAFAVYRKTLSEDRRILLDRYRLIDIAIKVVGVGSVGTACWVLLMMAGPEDVLFLQVKQANPSVFEKYAGKSRYANHGERVVQGQRLMQSASDIFLGWTHAAHGKHYFVRQLRDMKIKPLVELYSPMAMEQYGEISGWALAHSHARSGHPALIRGYLGSSDKFDRSIADFAFAYADQNEKDYEVFANAAREGKFEVQLETP